jgi:trehalose-phosphatase
LELTSPTPLPPLPNALVRWPEIAHRLRSARPALFLDYDGTLSPIAPRPELATLPPGTREVLARLATRYPVAILSGRGREDVAALVDLPELTYAGSHGFDIAGPGLRHEVGEGIPATVERVGSALAAELAAIGGALVEPKRFAVAVHYRLVRPEEVPAVEVAVDRAAQASGLRKTGGKMVWELRPAIDWHKGKALLWLLDRVAPDALPLYIGDDVTDEDAFAAIAERGIGIVVTEEPRPSAARYALADPGEVWELLRRIGEGAGKSTDTRTNTD